MPLDYPRINQWPEWFTVNADDEYRVEAGGRTATHKGRELIEGLPVELTPDGLEQRLVVTR